MPRTTVNVDDVLLLRAQDALGTSGVTQTVNAALALAVRRAALASFDVRSFDITDEDLSQARLDRGAP